MARSNTARAAWLTAAVLTGLIATGLQANPLGGGTGTVSIDFSEYAFPQDSGTVAIQNDDATQTLDVNLFDDGTGANLSADNNDLTDLSVRFTTSAGGAAATSNRPRLIWRDKTGAGKHITGELSYAATPEANNPGTRQFIEVEVRFAPHLTITAVDLDTSSFNTSGTAWEFSQVSFLDAQYQPFSTATPVPRYLDAGADGLTGNLGLGHFYWAHTRTVTEVGSNRTETGSNGPNDSQFVLASSATGLTGQRIGGFTWRTTLEDTRGVDNPSSPAFSASLRQMDLTGTINAAPAIAFVKAAGTPSGTAAGDQILYSFTVTNSGNTPLQNLALSDPLLGGAISCPRTTLAVGEAISCSATAYTLTQADVDATSVSNTATVTAESPTGTAVTDSSTVISEVDPDESVALEKTASAPDAIEVGATITFNYTITNTGQATLTDATINDPLLDDALVCGSGNLPVGDQLSCQATYLLTQADLDAGTLSSVATATARDSQNNLISDVATVTVDLPRPPPQPENTTNPAPAVPVPVSQGWWLLVLALMMMAGGARRAQRR